MKVGEMKIEKGKSRGPAAVGGATPAGKTPPAAAPSSIEAPVDVVEIAGVPEAEMTPRVRAALVSLMEEVAALRRDITAMRARIVELESLADRDPLLGVLNRRAFVAMLERSLALLERYGQPSSLIFIDVDGLKRINDELGHAAGDAALRTIAETIIGHVRQTDAFGRIGGDEFGLILTNAKSAEAAAKAEAIRELVRQRRLPFEGREIALSVSVGSVEVAAGASAEDALASADAAMYARKRGD